MKSLDENNEATNNNEEEYAPDNTPMDSECY
jgi:hypothetical protein